MSGKVLVVGSMNMDMTVRMTNLPGVGETIFSKNLKYGLGGKGANQACAVARLGGTVKMLGCVGNDSFGVQQKENLSNFGVDAADIKTADNAPTGTAFIYVDDKGDNTIVVERGANWECSREYIEQYENAIRESDYVLLQMEIPQETLFHVIARAKAFGKTVILNPAPAPEHLPDEICRKIDYLTPNETELLKLTGQSNEEITKDNFAACLEKGAKLLLNQGIGTVIVTLGSEGCMVFRKDFQKYYPACKVKAVDSTAAGDCFNGAFTEALADGMQEEEAIRFAMQAAAISVTRNGAQDSIPARSEVSEQLWKGTGK